MPQTLTRQTDTVTIELARFQAARLEDGFTEWMAAQWGAITVDDASEARNLADLARHARANYPDDRLLIRLVDRLAAHDLTENGKHQRQYKRAGQITAIVWRPDLVDQNETADPTGIGSTAKDLAANAQILDEPDDNFKVAL